MSRQKNHHRKSTSKKIWQTYDMFPFGYRKGELLKDIAVQFPDYLLWWQRTNKVVFSESLQKIINQQKLLAQ